jgi:flagellar biosynthesis/type III secretory pathway protein FliH
LDNLVHWVVEFSEALRTPSGIDAVSRVFHYIALVCDDLHYDQFRAKIREQLPEAERTAMTIAEELIQKGRAEGRAQGQAEGRAQGQAEGRAQGQANLFMKLLTRKFGDVPTEYRTCIEAATVEQLERYAERFVVVDTLAAIFADD